MTKKKNRLRFQAEVVDGKCPTCDQFTMLVSIDRDFFRCMSCGSDLEQHVNGKITYLPVITAPQGCKTICKRMVRRRWRKNLKITYGTRSYLS
jgi:uncharacterized protein (DUF983 family)